MRFLGPDLPPEEIVRASATLRARAVALSAVHPPLDAAGVERILVIHERLSEDVAVIIGGGGAEPHHSQWVDAGISTFPDLPSFREGLREIRRRGA